MHEGGKQSGSNQRTGAISEGPWRGRARLQGLRDEMSGKRLMRKGETIHEGVMNVKGAIYDWLVSDPDVTWRQAGKSGGTTIVPRSACAATACRHQQAGTRGARLRGKTRGDELQRYLERTPEEDLALRDLAVFNFTSEASKDWRLYLDPC